LLEGKKKILCRQCLGRIFLFAWRLCMMEIRLVPLYASASQSLSPPLLLLPCLVRQVDGKKTRIIQAMTSQR
jgi:hypothetical protein